MSCCSQSSFVDRVEFSDTDTSSSSTSSRISQDTVSNEMARSRSRSRNKKSNESNPGSLAVDYGPIRVFHRRAIPQTLATGRRSKDEPLSDEEAIKREIRRAKNRIACRELKRTREEIEMNLVEKLKELEQEKVNLQNQHIELEARKAQLNRAVYNAKQAPLVPLITDLNFSEFVKSQNQQHLLTNLYSLLNNCDEECSSFD
ncbi:hypothetical protein I4U23_028355 [Adineta vaga]|nr:hypothetical protein I4U23_028355 [Adineta vaga]